MTSTSWFPSPLKWLPQPLTAVTLGITLNLFFRRYPDLKNRLAELEDKIFQFDVENLEQSFFMVVDVGGDVRIHTYSDTLPHVTMSGSSHAFISLLFNTKDPDSLFFSRALKLSGETDTGLHFKNILDNVDVDWEAELASFMGTAAAKVAVRMAEQWKHAKEQGWDKTEAGFENWIKEHGVPRQSHLVAFQEQVTEISALTERLERSLSRVERKRALQSAP